MLTEDTIALSQAQIPPGSAVLCTGDDETTNYETAHSIVAHTHMAAPSQGKLKGHFKVSKQRGCNSTSLDGEYEVNVIPYRSAGLNHISITELR